MNFDLSELDKLSSKEAAGGRKKVPNILAKAVRGSNGNDCNILPFK
jgi:hypothetical protein